MRSAPLLIALILVLAAAALYQFQAENPEMPERIKMATMWFDDIPTESAIRSLMGEINQSGANSVAVGIHNKGVLYFDTGSTDIRTENIAPVITGEARKQGLKVFIWTDTINFPELLEENPDWEFVTCVRSGRYHYPSDCGWHERLSPFNPGLDDFVREYYHDLARLDIDGIQFQDDLFLAEGEDFSDAAQDAFLEHYGFPPDPRNTEHLRLMQELKISRITELTKLAMESAREVNPDLIFIFDVLPEAERDKMLNWWSIDIQGLQEAGVDYFGIMSYHPQIMQEMKTDLEGSMDYLNNAFKSISSQAGRYRVIYRLWVTTFDYSHDPLPAGEISYVTGRMLDAGAYHIGYVPHHPGILEQSPFTGIE
jgi:uncharacterized lipoprotein YddW (UPF0748 family)